MRAIDFFVLHGSVHIVAQHKERGSTMASDKQSVKATSSEKPDETTKKHASFLASHKSEIIIGGFTLMVLLFLIFAIFLFISSYFERVEEAKVLNRKLEAAVMLACKIDYKKYPTKVTFQKLENSQGKKVIVLVCKSQSTDDEEE